MLRSCHDIRFTKLCQPCCKQSFDAIELQIPFVFFGGLTVGFAVVLMASSRQELVLLGGVFVVGFTTLQLSIALGGL